VAREQEPGERSPAQERQQRQARREQTRERRQRLQEQRRQLIQEDVRQIHRARRAQGRSANGRHRPQLSREEVVRAALAIVDREGLEGFSMRKLGRELGVDPMAVYYYFPNKAAVLDGIVDAVNGEVALPQDRDAPWKTRLRDASHAYRRALRAHPHALPVMSTRPTFSETSRRVLEGTAAILCDAGFPPAEALEIVGVLGGYLIGVTLAEVGVQPGGIPDPTQEEVLEQARRLPPEEFPILRAAFDAGRDWDSDAQFDRGLDLLIAGIESRLADRER
jgi:TetR/AcrR family tetracycline transcriptional repressor